MSDFVHLHVHTAYSLLDGASRIDRLIARAKELGQKAVAITDHGVMYGVIDFCLEAKKAGIKPIVGCEVYVAARTLHDKTYEEDYKRSHLVLLAMNEAGYRNLLKLVSIGATEGFYGKPRVDKPTMRRYSEGLICLSACIAGEIPKAILSNDPDGARALVEEYISIFGRERFFLEIQDHGAPEEKKVNLALRDLAGEYGLGLAATNDVHYVNRRDAQFQDVLMCIQTGKTIHDKDRMAFPSDEFYLKSAGEMAALFPQYPEALENTVKIADMCNFFPSFGAYHLPVYPLPEGEDAFALLRSLCLDGLSVRYPDPGAHRDRLLHELSTIQAMGFVDYFLIVWDFIKYARENGILVGPGRGSAAGSLVSYALGITDVDPIRYGLIFERFLNAERITMPDIDIDFDYERRGEVIDYVVEKYGKSRVAQIITFGTMKARQAVRDVARALDVPYAEADAIAKMIPFDLHQTLENAMELSKPLRTLYETNSTAKRVIDISKELEGLPRHASTHAAGVVITKNDLSDYVPLQLSDEAVVTQFPMTTLEELGLLKMDFLGLRNLTIIAKAAESIPGGEVALSDMTDHPEVYKLISSGHTDGIFQLESKGMKAFMRELRPRCLEDIIAGISLYRPGPMDSIPRYVKSKNAGGKAVCKHPLLEPILSMTYGCIVYQEQVMQIVQTLAGYSLGRADILRRAMSKKKSDVMERERQSFIYGDEQVGGAVARGVDAQTASEIFDEMTDFAKYAFNKSHAAAYAVIAYRTAWLKTFYPVQFMAALLSTHLDDSSKITLYTDEMSRMGISLLPPDVNESGIAFTVSGKNIRFGLAAVKNVGRSFAQQVLEARRERPFTGLSDFCERLSDKGLNRRALESLVRVGAFSSLGGARSQYLSVLEQTMTDAASRRRYNLTGQLSLMGEEHTADDLPPLAEFARSELLSMEKELMGIFVSGHPLEPYKELIQKHADTSIAALSAGGEDSDGIPVRVAGIITARSKKYTKKDAQMAFITLEDLTGSIEVIVFPKILSRLETVIEGNGVVSVTGKLSLREDEPPKIIMDSAFLIDDHQNAGRLYVKIPAGREGVMQRLKDILRVFPGETPVFLYLEQAQKTLAAPEEYWVTPSKTLEQELLKLLGSGSDVVLRRG